MEFSSWLLFASVITLASISPGPNVLAVIANTVDKGVYGAVYTIFGNLIALFTIALVAALGVGAMLQAMPSVFSVMKLAGGLYLAWIGFKMLKGSFSSVPAVVSDVGNDMLRPVKPLSVMAQAMLISYSNPKSILFLSAVFPTFLSTSDSVPLQFGIMFSTIITIVTLIHGTYALLALKVRGSLVSGRVRQWMSRISGITFVGFGAGFVLDSQR